MKKRVMWFLLGMAIGVVLGIYVSLQMYLWANP